MQKWESRTLTVTASMGWVGKVKVDFPAFTSELNRLGQEGWEVVGVFTTNRSYGMTHEVVAMLKRPFPTCNC